MHFKTIIAIVAGLSAGMASADARFESGSVATSSFGGLQYAQSSIEALGESDLRRLVFYTERTIGSLNDIVEASDTGEFDDLGKLIENLRSNISRLSDAGGRSGIPREDITDFFVQTVVDGHGGDFLEKVSNAAGGLDIPTLFRNVEAPSAPNTAALNDNSEFLNALANESAGLTLNETAGQVEVVETTDEADGPVAGPNATAAEHGVIDRIEVTNSGWKITVVAGDSLALIASALYGDSLSYNVIYQANLNVLNNPNSLNIGDRLTLPKP